MKKMIVSMCEKLFIKHNNEDSCTHQHKTTYRWGRGSIGITLVSRDGSRPLDCCVGSHCFRIRVVGIGLVNESG